MIEIFTTPEGLTVARLVSVDRKVSPDVIGATLPSENVPVTMSA